VSALKTRIETDIKTAMRAGERQHVSDLRLVSAAIKQREVDERRELSDSEVIEVLSRMAKQRRESLDHFDAANRAELAKRERAQLAAINSYLPAAVSDAELEAAIVEAIAESEAQSLRDMGRVMGTLKERLHGQADMSEVSSRVRERLGE